MDKQLCIMVYQQSWMKLHFSVEFLIPIVAKSKSGYGVLKEIRLKNDPF